VGRATRRDEKDAVKIKAPLCRTGDSQMAEMNRIESAPEKGDPAASRGVP
jgi:hypothetical protein